MNSEYSPIDLESVIITGDKVLQAEHLEGEKAKAGNLRGGDSGCVHQGEVYGCHRKAIARNLGYNMPIDYNSYLFFANGYGQEEQLSHKLKAGWGEVKSEDEVPVVWNLPSGRKVTGRPDFELLESGQAKLGVELKTICSANACKRTGLEHTPDAKHLCQAAHYMWQHNIPWVLTYISPSRFVVNNFKNRATGHKELPDYPGVIKVDPFRAHFYLKFVDGVLHYQHPKTGQDVETIVSVEGIQQYYQLIDECLTNKTLYFPPVSRYATGKAMPFNHVRYCEYCTAAERADGNWDRWLDELSSMIEEKS